MTDAAFIDRFNAKWGPVPEAGCWLWTACTTKGGYGRMAVDGVLHLAHRIAWAMQHGAIPEKLHVCHKCDTPACVNPAHLFLGTHTENLHDMIAKGRAADVRGSCNGRASLRESDIPGIRADTRTHKAIADSYGVTESTIQSIKKRRTWGHVL